MPWAGDRAPQPYRRESVMTMPVEAPGDTEPAAEGPPGYDGKPRSPDYLRTSLGLAPRGAASREDAMTWEPVL